MEERAWVPHGGAGPPPDTDDIYLLMDYLYLSCERIAVRLAWPCDATPLVAGKAVRLSFALC